MIMFTITETENMVTTVVSCDTPFIGKLLIKDSKPDQGLKGMQIGR